MTSGLEAGSIRCEARLGIDAGEYDHYQCSLVAEHLGDHVLTNIECHVSDSKYLSTMGPAIATIIVHKVAH